MSSVLVLVQQHHKHAGTAGLLMLHIKNPIVPLHFQVYSGKTFLIQMGSFIVFLSEATSSLFWKSFVCCPL